MYFAVLFFFNYMATTEIYTYVHTLSLHDALPISYHQCYRSAGSSRCDGVGKEKRLRRARRERGLGRGVNPSDDMVRGKSLLVVGEATTKREADQGEGAKDQLRNSGVTVVCYSAHAGKGRRRREKGGTIRTLL